MPEIEKTIQNPSEIEEKIEKASEPLPVETQSEQKSADYLEYGRMLLKEKKYKEAVEFFLNNLKKS